MRARNALLGCLSLLIFAPAVSSSDRDPSTTCGTIQITAPGVPPSAKRRVKIPAFSASIVLDLKIDMTLSPALKGLHQVEFRLYTPKGHLYQSLTATMSAPAPSADRRKREIARPTASALLPVAGTTIVSSSLYGEWKVEAFLDGENTEACAKPLAFVIDP